MGGGGGKGEGQIVTGVMNMRAVIFCIHDTLSLSLQRNCVVS